MRKSSLFNTAAVFRAAVFIIAVSTTAPSQSLESANLSAAGSNRFRYADGYNNDFDPARPWNYLVNNTDLQLGLGDFYTRLRFDIEEPGTGFNPVEPVHREYFSRRTIGYDNSTFSFEAGHVMTQFGRGLSLALKEDREVERYTLLDGVYGRLILPWLSLQGIAGRPLEWRNTLVPLTVKNGIQQDTIEVDNLTDLWMRDMISGAYAELFLPAQLQQLPFISSGSLGGGIVRYATNVGPQLQGLRDTSAESAAFWYQNRNVHYIPSITGSVTSGAFSLTVEHARLNTTTCSLTTTDSSSFESSTSLFAGPATYVAAAGNFLSVNVLAEYKNYFYERSSTLNSPVAPFLIPPQVHYQHSWHLLDKYQPSNLMDDIIGYNIMVSWTPDMSSQVIFDASYGGRHAGGNLMSVNDKNTWRELYGEWSGGGLADLLHCKTALGWRRDRIDYTQPDITTRTLATELFFGPLRDNQSFGITFEGQFNSRHLYAEKSRSALVTIIRHVLPEERVAPYLEQQSDQLDTAALILYLDPSVADTYRTPYSKSAFNILGTFTYSYSPWLTIGCTVEHESDLARMAASHLIGDLHVPEKTFASCAVRITPHPNHTLSIEYGSMSGGKRCTLGTCVDIPAFEGLKVELTSTL